MNLKGFVIVVVIVVVVVVVVVIIVVIVVVFVGVVDKPEMASLFPHSKTCRPLVQIDQQSQEALCHILARANFRMFPTSGGM